MSTQIDPYISLHESITSLHAQLAASEEHVLKLTAQNANLIVERDKMSAHAVTVSLQRIYIAEVSTFHRESLLPLLSLLAVVQQVITTMAKNIPAEQMTEIAKLRQLVTSVEERTKHYNSQALVEQARKNALDAQKVLETRVLPLTTP